MVTQGHIARTLGISRQLVSMALGGYPQVSAESRKSILATARKMGYRPNPHARALKGGRTGLIALWKPNQISTHYTRISLELSRLVEKAGCSLIVKDISTLGAEQVLSHVPVDGVIAYGTVEVFKQASACLELMSARSIPVVMLGSEVIEDTDTVRVDWISGTADLMEHLISSGFRRIAHATFVRTDSPFVGRRSGYLRAMRKAGLEPEFIYYPVSEKQRAAARHLIKAYVRKQGCPEAIFCHSDDVAMGFYRGLCDLHKRIPQEVALAGCNGIEDVEYLECPLTTIAQPVTAMCATAWKFLQNRLERPKMRKQYAVLKPELIVRESTRREVFPVRGATASNSNPHAPLPSPLD